MTEGTADYRLCVMMHSLVAIMTGIKPYGFKGAP